MNRTSIEIEAEILKKKLEESMAARKRQQEKTEEQEETIRNLREQVQNQSRLIEYQKVEIKELDDNNGGYQSRVIELVRSIEEKDKEIAELQKKLDGDRNEEIEELKEHLQDLRQLAANQDAEITELRRRMAGISSVLDDLIESETKEKQILEGCRNVLEKMKAEADRI